MPVLSFQKNARGRRGVVDGQHDDRARVVNNIAPCPDPAGFLNLIRSDPENWPAIYGSGGEDSFFASLFGENFRHTDTIKHGVRFSAPGFRKNMKVRAGRRKPEAPSAMLPGMVSKPVVAIVGAGNFGTALAVALQRAGYSIEAVIARSRGSSLRKAQRLAKLLSARASTDPSA